jgi:hypothetical protein
MTKKTKYKTFRSPKLKWYTDLVVIMDSNDKVYIYQTRNLQMKKLNLTIKLYWFKADI